MEICGSPFQISSINEFKGDTIVSDKNFEFSLKEFYVKNKEKTILDEKSEYYKKRMTHGHFNFKNVLNLENSFLVSSRVERSESSEGQGEEEQELSENSYDSGDEIQFDNESSHSNSAYSQWVTENCVFYYQVLIFNSIIYYYLLKLINIYNSI